LDAERRNEELLFALERTKGFFIRRTENHSTVILFHSLLPTRNHQPRIPSFILATWNSELATGFSAQSGSQDRDAETSSAWRSFRFSERSWSSYTYPQTSDPGLCSHNLQLGTENLQLVFQRKAAFRNEMLKQVQHDGSLNSLNDLDLPTSILKPLIPAFALTTCNLQLILW